jgi:hypothetical protein
LSASTALAGPSDKPAAIPTHNNQALRDFVIIGPQHTCGGEPPLSLAVVQPNGAARAVT